MAGRIGNPPPNPNLGANWPWRPNIREKIVERNQLIDRKKAKRKGDAKNPPLASSALLEFMGPGHTSEELRFPAPVSPRGREAQSSEENVMPALANILERGGEQASTGLARELGRLNVPPDRIERLKSLLQREAGMLQVMGRLQTDLVEIQQKIHEENRGKGY